VIFFAPIKGLLFEYFKLSWRGYVRIRRPGHMLVRLSQKAARTAARIINRLADFRIDNLDHRPDDFARREELATIIALLAHLQQQTFIYLRQGEDMGRINVGSADFVDLVEYVEKILFGI